MTLIHPSTSEGQSVPDTRTLPGASLTALLLTLSLGLGATAFVFHYVVGQDEQQLQTYVGNAAAAIATSTSQTTYTQPVFDEINNVFAGIQQDVTNDVPITPQRLRNYLWKKPIQGLETTSLELLPRVTANELKSRETAKALTGHAEESTAPVIEDTGNGTAPASPRDDYFPILLEAGYGANLEPVGLDRSNLPDYQLAMMQARDSGMMTMRTRFPASEAASENFVAVYYYPIYRGGVPATVQERRERLLGFVSAVTRYPGSAFYSFLPQSYHGIVATFVPALAPARVPAGDESGIAGFLQRPDVKQGNYQTQGVNFTVVATASDALRQLLNGTTRWWILGLGGLVNLWMLSLLLWSRRQANRIVALVNERTHDLAERTKALTAANSALRQSELRYRTLADNISDVIFTCDKQGRFTYVSPSILELSGYAADDLVNSLFYSHLDLPSAQVAQQSFGQAVKTLEEHGGAETFHEVHEYQMLRKDGVCKPVESTLDALLGDDGRIIGFVGVMRDISERKRAEKEKDTLQQAYQQSQKMEAVGTLAGGIAHDFNNLLTGMLGHADMLKSESTQTPEALHSIAMIETAALRAKDLTSQLLGFARKGKFMQVPVEINTVLSELVGLLERTLDKNIQLTRITSAGNPTVLGDPSQINQVFLNLAVNARDAMPKGGSLGFKTEIVTLDELTAQASFGLVAGDYCMVSVSDTGIGIAPDKLERIFEPFFTDKEEGKGTGLGLAMVYGVVKNHKGAVKVYSEPGKGSIFRILLPLHANKLAEQRRPLARSLVQGSGTVLLIDDQHLVRQVGDKMLRQLGYEVVLRENGIDGLDYYRDHWRDIDVVMIDMMMPQMGGLECLDEMKKINPRLKAILSTGFSREDIAEKIQQSHILGFIQ
ncbi:MAG TPA: ATP-binding protein, partial [Candidatus Acidoferrum sp.]|nr:ATP-binding protein [Candidatus Acidoferrum sp.]